MITIYTYSHIELARQFAFSAARSNMRLRSFYYNPQTDEKTGSYGTKDFKLATLGKIECILEVLRTSQKDFEIYCDVDVLVFKDIVPFATKILQDNPTVEIFAQRDWAGVCTGFMIIRNTWKNIKFFEGLVEYIKKNIDREGDFHDQIAFAEYCAILGNNAPIIGLLDINQGFGNMNHVAPGVLWEEGMSIPLTADQFRSLYMWHANFTVGVENKIKMLDLVQKEINEYKEVDNLLSCEDIKEAING